MIIDLQDERGKFDFERSHPYIYQMELDPQIIQQFMAALPGVRRAVKQLVTAHAAQAVAVSRLNFNRLPQYFPANFLNRAKVVVVKKMPVLPLDQFGLSQLSGQLPDGIGLTLNDTVFVRQGSEESDSLHFHELVHVAQWQCLGVDRFLIAYGVGLVQFGYRQSPLEEMAYSLQKDFDRGSVANDLLVAIDRGCDALWKQILPLLPRI